LENKRVLVDTSILIEFFRKKDKKKSILYNIQKTHKIYTSTISEFEFLAGVSEDHAASLNKFFKKIDIIPFDSRASIIASSIYKNLKSRNQIIEFRDIFIAATAIANDLPAATLNENHFGRIERLKLLTVKTLI
jgi:tRNA(fMet)-specific endonuclease VapC